ncbi:sensor histidine kinase [Propionibacterium freudenreichii]|uniref:sensor histidine kinase n=1 Tax=Propionibacterium freudenreichii TaxID=1744 RepID=UPI0005A5C416|nr:HAMP domain-containing sensor histidine kinase [Propionibacterium freudenreichii]MCT3013809.1 sensor histidine kinase [Propionibacterium freudenreichii]MDK9319753.1 HAMP domain-containing protein [Propionibacterium freudenreichii]MDK9344347.1 HAMP domain-containing protein [Propionibacterium freudenreichii]MDK9612357.1 HAMP domain-containing protein [Propionibacterium freudenreichii]MDK9621148.1 HAMP domain-containing protein [Propionibacterium freudenreichii]
MSSSRPEQPGGSVQHPNEQPGAAHPGAIRDEAAHSGTTNSATPRSGPGFVAPSGDASMSSNANASFPRPPDASGTGASGATPVSGATGTVPVSPGTVPTAAGQELLTQTTNGMARARKAPAMAKGTLSRQLVARISALVAAIAILLGVLSTFVVYQILVNEVDHELSQSVGAESRNSSPTGSAISLGGLPADAVVVIQQGDGTTVGSVETYDRTQTVRTSSGVNDAIAKVPVDPRAHTVRLAELGSYRVVASNVRIGVPNADGSESTVSAKLFVGVPMERSNSVIHRLVIFEAILAALAIGTAAIIARSVVRRSLDPLNHLATTADEVSRMDLEKGEVNLPSRIPNSETDPKNEVGRVGLSFNRMLDNVEGALTAREASENKVKQFVADASHELRNPLASIRGYAELAQRRANELDPDTAFAMSRITSESERMSGLVEDMLLLARLDTKPELQLAETDVVEVVLNAASDAQVAGPDHHWRLNLPDEAVTVMADRNQLHQVVANLLSNARKHTPAGTQVDTSVGIEGDQAVIRVHDNGPGVPPEIADKVFERFARADVARTHDKEGSTGLGLAIVAAVMAAHGGTAALDSSDGHTTFTLRLPLASDDSGRPAGPPPQADLSH